MDKEATRTRVLIKQRVRISNTRHILEIRHGVTNSRKRVPGKWCLVKQWRTRGRIPCKWHPFVTCVITKDKRPLYTVYLFFFSSTFSIITRSAETIYYEYTYTTRPYYIESRESRQIYTAPYVISAYTYIGLNFVDAYSIANGRPPNS